MVKKEKFQGINKVKSHYSGIFCLFYTSSLISNHMSLGKKSANNTVFFVDRNLSKLSKTHVVVVVVVAVDIFNFLQTHLVVTYPPPC